MKGKQIAVYGLGRSGLAIVRAALALGAEPVVYDKALPEQMAKQDVLESARELGIEIHLGWDENFDASRHDWLVVNPSVDSRSPLLRKAVGDGLEMLSEVEFAYRVLEARFGTRIPQPPSPSGAQSSPQGEGGFPALAAITGTNGKSTTTVMTYLALRECGIDAVLCGNIFGSGLPEMPLTEAALHATPDQVLVAEISSFQLEWVSRFRPAVAGITNIVADHLDRYDSFQDYAATKMRIFAAQTAEDYAVIRAYDPVVTGSAAFSRRGRAGRPRSDEMRATVLTFGAQGEQAEVGEDSIRILDKMIKTEDMQVIGTHNYANAAMAGLMAWGTLRWLSSGGDIPVPAPAQPEQIEPSSIGGSNASATARRLLQEAETEAESKQRPRSVYSGRPPTTAPLQATLPALIVLALKSFKGIEHRMEYLGSKNGVRIINNSMCTNPDAVVKSAQAVKGPNHLIMGGKDKDLPFTPVRNYLASGMHKAYLYGEAKDLLNEQLGGGFPTYNTMQEAFQAATEKARPGEVIMLAPGCASTDQFQDFRDRGNVFKTIAKEWLES